MIKDEKLETMAGVVRRKTKQVAKSKVDLEITPNMKIGTAVYIKTKIVNLPAVKKKDSRSDAPVRMDRTYIKVEDPEVAVDEKDKLTALRYGSEYVPTPSADLEGMKLRNQTKCLKVMGFFDANIFGIERLVSNCECIAAEPNNPHAAIALSSLIHAMLEEKKAALCRFSGREGSEPKLMVLFPHVEDSFECLYSVQAPFAEDSRENTLLFASLPKPDQEILDTIDDLIDSRILMDGTEELLVPDLIPNPTLHRFWQTVEKRLENEQAPVVPVDPTIDTYIHPERTLFAQKDISKLTSKIRELAKLEEIFEEAKNKRKAQFWRQDISAESLIQSPIPNIDVKRIRVESSPERRFLEAQNPVRIYMEEMHKRSDSSLSTNASSQAVYGIQDLISGLIDTGAIGKAAESIQTLRNSCIEEKQSELFNDYLRSLEVEKLPRLWRELIGRGIMLISSSESKEIEDVNDEQAREHFEHAMRML
jgi:ATP-dependent DNA helicase 2 subunit 2